METTLVMDNTIVLLLVGQSAVIIGSVAASYIKTRVALAKLEVRGENLEARLMDLKADHENLASKVDGVSRAMSRLQGVNEGTGKHQIL